MLKKYTLIGFLLLCSCGSSKSHYSGYDEDNYWYRNGRYGRYHHHSGHGHQHGGGHQGHSKGGGHHGGKH